MGSIEVFDYQQMKWVPYVPQPDKADRYYEHARQSIEKSWQGTNSRMAQQLKEATDNLRAAEEKLKRMNERTPKVKLVTPVAQAIEMAKSEIKMAERQNRMNKGQKKYPTVDWEKLNY